MLAPHLHFYRKQTPWYICLVRQAIRGSLTSKGKDFLKKKKLKIYTTELKEKSTFSLKTKNIRKIFRKKNNWTIAILVSD